ncbi:MAG: polysaccharide deacetylase family protein [Lachnospiraceae bacterium]|nr:polysaccharide deacetylase family protein [Lachnospiraceae bacterium]
MFFNKITDSIKDRPHKESKRGNRLKISVISGKKILCLGIVLLISICTFVGFSEKQDKTIQANAGVVNNKKIAWGLKRGEGESQPTLGTANMEVLNKYEGIAMGNPDEKVVYLTFDEGYENGYTAQMLDVLKENDVKAAFFITGGFLNNNSDLVQRMVDEGHTVGNHTVNHYSMPDIDDETLKSEIMDLHSAVFEKTGYEMKYVRPPKGEYSDRTVGISKSLGYTTVLWSFAYDDWNRGKQGRLDYAKTKILENLHNGEVILLHAVSSDNASVLDECIKQIKSKGYVFKTLDEFN